MSKRGVGKYFGLAVAAAAAAVAVKYLKDYTDFREAAEPDLSNLKDSAGMTKEAAKRTYISIRDKGDVKEAAGDLAKAAGRMAKDAGNVAVTAGKTTVDTVKDIKAKYDEDPEAAKAEVIDNFKDMKDDIADSLSGAAEKLSSIWKSEDEPMDDFMEAEELYDPETSEDLDEDAADEEALEGAEAEAADDASEEEPEEDDPFSLDDDELDSSSIIKDDKL